MNINCQPPLQFVYFSTDTHIPWISHNTLRDRLFKNGVAIRKKVYCHCSKVSFETGYIFFPPCINIIYVFVNTKFMKRSPLLYIEDTCLLTVYIITT